MKDLEKLKEIEGGFKKGEMCVFGSSGKTDVSIFEAANTCLGVERTDKDCNSFKIYKLNPETDKYELVAVKQY